MRLLIVEDAPLLRETLAEGLRHAGYAVDVAGDGHEGLWLAQSNPYDLVILDIMLPGMDGLRVLRALRDEKFAGGVLLLTAKDQLEDKITGLRGGADDYLVKPFAFDELLARIEAIIRRHHGQPAATLTVGPLAMDIAARTATLAGQRLELSPREFHLLQYLMLRRGQIASRSDIEAHIYDQNASLMSNVVDTVICALRKKLAIPGHEPLIRTRRGMGYELAEPS